MRILWVLAVLWGLSAHAQFIVPDQQYRCPLDGPCTCPPDRPSCPLTRGLKATEARTTGNGNQFTVHYVEFRDSGDLFDRRELEEALDAVRGAPSNGKQTLLVVYVNGWQNNADEPGCGNPPCADVAKFRDVLLTKLADELPGFNVMGVYLGWRGLTFTIEPFKHIISYWPRRSKYFYVLAGHSFGARVLENAAESFEKEDSRGNKVRSDGLP